MEAYQKRLIVERAELLSRMVKLVEFLASDEGIKLDKRKRRLMWRQQDIMVEYSRVLCERIAEFEE